MKEYGKYEEEEDMEVGKCMRKREMKKEDK